MDMERISCMYVYVDVEVIKSEWYIGRRKDDKNRLEPEHRCRRGRRSRASTILTRATDAIRIRSLCKLNIHAACSFARYTST